MSLLNVDEMESPYLVAIQKIPGKTPGEKYRYLNGIARKLINEAMDIEGDEWMKNIVIKSSDELPECLVPIVSLEIAKIIRQPEGIVSALKSDDSFINDRALKVKWFFDGTNKNITNADYFDKNIFPHVSLIVRNKIVRNLAKYLILTNNQSIAEEFYNKLKKQYGKKLARPICFACSEEFIKNTVKDLPTISEMEIIYSLYPNIAIELLKQNAFSYAKFLPTLLKKHPNEFVEIIVNHLSLYYNIKLTHKKCELVFKNLRNSLIENGEIFIKIIPLKLITARLTKCEFNKFFEQLFPENISAFNFTRYFGYLKYYIEEEKLSLLMSTFETVYKKKLLDCDNHVTHELSCLLSPEERVSVVRKILKKDTYVVNSWVSHLPTNESIPDLKEKILNSSKITDRCEYLKQMIYSCSVNKDQDALLSVLDYIFMRHINEQNPTIPNVLYELRLNFDVKKLPKEHLAIVDKFVRFLYVKNELKSGRVGTHLLCDLIYSKLVHNEEITEYMNILHEVITVYQFFNEYPWDIFENYPEYGRTYLHEFIMTINVESYEQPAVINSILSCCIYDFNEKNSKAEAPLEYFSIKNFPLLFKAVEKILTRDREIKNEWDMQETDRLVKNGEKDLFYLLTGRISPVETLVIEEIEFYDSKVIKLLQKSPEKIMENWNDYLRKCKNNIKRWNLARRFLRSARWHQDLPILFANKCLNELSNENNNISENLYILAVLYEGKSYEKIFIPFIPETMTLYTSNKDTEDEYKLNCSILWSLNVVNPPVSFNPILEFCQGDYVHKAVNYLNNIGRRVPIENVMEFSKILVNQNVSVKKHSIRLFCLVASTEQIQEIMINLWKTENHISIREIIFKYISKLFSDVPSLQSWSLMKNCINEVKIDDFFWDCIFDLNNVTCEFFELYVVELLKTIERIEKIEENFDRQLKIQRYVKKILRNCVPKSNILSEHFHQDIIRTYFADLSRPEYSLSYDVHYFVVRGYICMAGDKLETRLAFLMELCLEIVEKYWNIPSKYDDQFLTANRMICGQLINSVIEIKNDDIRRKTATALHDNLLKVLQPEQLGTRYFDIKFAIFIDSKDSVEQLAYKLGQIIPDMVDKFSTESMPMIVDCFMKACNTVFNDLLDDLLEVIVNLITSNDNRVTLFASKLFFKLDKDCYNNDKYSMVIDKLKSLNIQSLI